MPALKYGRLLTAGLLVFVSSCEIVTEPGPGPGNDDAFSLLIERRSPAGQRSFYTMGARGTFFAPFTGVPADARTLIPSPDGKTIAYLRDVDGYVRLWAMDRDGANRRAILDGDIYVESAAWSPDGTRLAIGYSTETANDDIAVVNANGTGFVSLTSDPLPGVWFDRDPSWSPDGTRIAFATNRSGTQRLWLMNADGSNPVQVMASTSASRERNPVWSPDGAFIAAVAETPAGEGMAFIRPDGTDYKHVLLTTGPNDPVWLPDGRLVFVGSVASDFDLYTVDRVTGVSERLTSRSDDDVRAVVLAAVPPFAWLGFAAPVLTPINRPVAVDLDAGDVLTDGASDLMVLSPILNELRLMKGSGGGTFQSVGSLYSEADVSSITAAMVTTDLATDIVGRGDSAFHVWRGRADGPGIATTFTFPAALRDIAVADFNGNGRADIVAMTEAGTQPFRLSMYGVTGADAIVRSGEMTTTRTRGRSMCGGDVDGDGRLDLVMLAGTSGLSAFVALGRGDLTFGQATTAGSDISTDVEATPFCADFDGDGRDDLALLSIGQSSGVSVHLRGAAVYGLPSRINGSASSLAVADVDRDGDLDLIIGSSTNPQLLVAKNRGDGRFSQPSVVTLPNIPTRLLAADLNGDSWPDVAAVDAVGNLVVLLSRGRTGM
ncbi:MAG TPA: FG-GAP-like repeat-containing protein [Gemmatimonadaceae bacterium]|nr:FG-GAP-like repeat-containing protein [Gemmatimonadaceae bacterium]